MEANIQENKKERGWPAYRPQEIEPKWQQTWEETGIYVTRLAPDRQKYYCLDFFPYPSGEGLHVGHCRNYIPTDVLSRLKRMQGYNVLHPMGWDAFGEPAEQFAISRGVHPRLTTDRNTANYKRQMKLIGTSYDWTREIDSSDPEFYRWTQWFFLLLYERGLAYRDLNWQWWCPVCQTTLSSHEVSNGVCWRGHTGVTRRQIPAWYFKITAYADELISGLDSVDWPEPIKAMQRNWIGRSEGLEIQFEVEGMGGKDCIPVFTTRPDTLFGVTFFVLAPEHPLVKQITQPDRQAEVDAYVTAAVSRSEVERLAEARQKSGVFTGAFVINPVNGERVPVWVADYVLPGYGTGAVMGVPAHDQRDYDFARQFGLPVKTVIVPEGIVEVDEPPESAYVEDGNLVNSGPFNGMPSAPAREKIGAYLIDKGMGKVTVQYRMHDWLISRQRYWGSPIPILYCENCGETPVPADQLPVLLPPMENFAPDGSGRSPLARLPEFVNTTCPRCGSPAQRETDTMGGFADSSWYFLRFTSPNYGDPDHGPIDPEAAPYWMPVDLYVGGAEHAVLHLLYARFWTKVMADAGLVSFREPFARLLNQGQLLGADGKRMAKSRPGSVITPDRVAATYGADALRVYELFMAPFDQDIAWSEEGINGSRRFLNRIWTLYGETYATSALYQEKDPDLARALHRTIRHVTQRIEEFRFNTMISALMEFANLLAERQRQNTWRTSSFRNALETFLLLLAPAAPHIAEELWAQTGHTGSIHQQAWPTWDQDLAQETLAQVAVQVNGKLRDVLDVPDGVEQPQVEQMAFASQKVKPFVEGKDVVKVIYVPGKIVNIVVRG